MISSDPAAALAALRGIIVAQPAEAAAQIVKLARSLRRPEHILGAADLIAKIAGLDHGFPARRIAVAGEVTLNGIAAAATVALAGAGVIASTYVAPFGAFRQEALDPKSGLYAARPDIVLLAPLPQIDVEAAGLSDAESWVADQAAAYQDIWAILAQRLPGVRIVQHLIEMPDDDLMGPLERRTVWTTTQLSTKLNDALLAGAPAFVHLVDMDRLASRIGRQNWRDPRLWFYGKVPFALKHLDGYKTALEAALRRALGRTCKALIVDLDNTLWRGVIGDDGLEGIQLGPGSPSGEAHQAFCNYVKALGRRGIILGICSKNDPALALKVFDEHAHMPLRSDDFAAIQCNWDDKASNLRKIASELNIDCSAMVFVDDNAAECELIRRELPAVTVVPLSGDPSGFRGILDGLRLFEAEALSAEDVARLASYRGRSAAEAVRTQSANLDDYLSSLEMRGSVWDARDEDVVRLAQMEGKTNQFNVTTRRWSADQLRQFMAAGDHDVLCFRLADRFADHGLVSSAVVSHQGAETRILSWLMSCRVFSRTAEEFIANEIMSRARARGTKAVVGSYERTDKNGVIADLFPRLGFADDGDGFRLAVEVATPRKTFIADAAADENRPSRSQRL